MCTSFSSKRGTPNSVIRQISGSPAKATRTSSEGLVQKGKVCAKCQNQVSRRATLSGFRSTVYPRTVCYATPSYCDRSSTTPSTCKQLPVTQLPTVLPTVLFSVVYFSTPEEKYQVSAVICCNNQPKNFLPTAGNTTQHANRSVCHSGTATKV